MVASLVVVVVVVVVVSPQFRQCMGGFVETVWCAPAHTHQPARDFRDVLDAGFWKMAAAVASERALILNPENEFACWRVCVCVPHAYTCTHEHSRNGVCECVCMCNSRQWPQYTQLQRNTRWQMWSERTARTRTYPLHIPEKPTTTTHNFAPATYLFGSLEGCRKGGRLTEVLLCLWRSNRRVITHFLELFSLADDRETREH